MTILKCIKDKSISILILLLTLITTFMFIFLVEININYIIFTEMIFLFSFILILVIDFIRRKKFYNDFIDTFSELDEKSYITEIIEIPNFIEGQILYQSLKVESKYINDITSGYNNKFKEYRQYIETWVHEIKTPISTSKLLIENNKNITTLSIEEEIDKIDDYIEQVFYVTKSDTVEKDYHIKKLYLKYIITNTIKNKSKEIINIGMKTMLHDLDFYILSDSKWIEFIICQIISNSIKYRINKPTIEFYSEEINNKICLYIKDNGIGIPKEDISRVFEKGFAGVNGRIKSTSTGIGLYLCKKLCNKLEVDIDISSEFEKCTTVKLTFIKDI